MRSVFLVCSVLVFLVAGCQNRRFVHLGGSPGGNDYGIASAAVDQYAKEHRLTRQEAVEQLRGQRRQLDDRTRTVGETADETMRTARASRTRVLDESKAESRPPTILSPDGAFDAE